jgi:hypothetical protein
MQLREFVGFHSVINKLTFLPRGLSGYQARRQVADSRGTVFVAGLSLNIYEIVDQLPNPKVLWVASLKPCLGGEWHMGDVALTEPQGKQATSLSM